VKAGVEEALRNLRTDRIDIVHLHSCPIETLRNGEPVRALLEAVEDGKVRVVAYSGENEALAWAAESGHFGSVQHSVNICDQRCIDSSLRRETERALGVIAKRPLANAPWRYAECPKGEYVEEYWWRWKTMKIDPRGLDWDELALRFSAFTPGVCSCIVGTKDVNHLLRNLAIVEKGPLPPDFYESIRTAFKQNDPGWWRGEV
jgi:aryl-alcohol dehydrogenase-like predicted oxidoreductase